MQEQARHRVHAATGAPAAEHPQGSAAHRSAGDPQGSAGHPQGSAGHPQRSAGHPRPGRVPSPRFSRTPGPVQRQVARSLLRSFVVEAARAWVFAVVVAAVAGCVGFAFWAADISLVQADVFADGPTALMASVLPAFFAAWGYFLLRKIAWSGPGEAFAVGSAVTGLAVVAHRNVLLSTFFDDVAGGGDAWSAWVLGATGLAPRSGGVDTLLLAEVGVAVGVGLVALAAQRFVARSK